MPLQDQWCGTAAVLRHAAGSTQKDQGAVPGHCPHKPYHCTGEGGQRRPQARSCGDESLFARRTLAHEMPLVGNAVYLEGKRPTVLSCLDKGRVALRRTRRMGRAFDPKELM